MGNHADQRSPGKCSLVVICFIFISEMLSEVFACVVRNNGEWNGVEGFQIFPLFHLHKLTALLNFLGPKPHFLVFLEPNLWVGL